MDKGSHKVPIWGESNSEVFYFIPETRNSAEVTRPSDDINKPWLKATMKQIKISIKNQTFIVRYPEKGDTVTPCMNVYKDKLNLMKVLKS